MLNLKKTALSIALLCSASFTPAFASSLSTDEKQVVINQISDLMAKHYVFPDVAKKTNKALKKALEQGYFDDHTSNKEFAEALSKWLKENANDRHLRVRANPTQKQTKGAESRLRDRLLKPKRFGSDNKGVVSAEILEGNIGYLDLRGFYRLSESKQYIDSAMQLLSNSDAVIVDLRKNGGGSPRTVQYLCSYFFDQKLLLNSLYFREDDETTDFYVLDEVGGTKMPTTPLYVLTSKRTFSGAEEFSYNMLTQERATLVGEITGGGANPGGTYTINDDFRMFIATGTAINPITKTNWETTGVSPQVQVSADDALDKALELARTKLDTEWQTVKAKREKVSDKLFTLLSKVENSDLSLAKINSKYQDKAKKLVKKLELTDRDLAMLGHERWEKAPKYAAFIFEIAVEMNDSETFLYEFWARSMGKLNKVDEAKQIISTGLKKVEGDEHKEMLNNALAEIVKTAEKL